jgi:hypothetical protein
MSSDTTDLTPLPRCCDRHDDWQTLADHLVRDFSRLSAGDVLRELTQAKEAVLTFGLDGPEQIGVAELMARHQLLLLTGQVPDAARLDPERHQRSNPAP